MPSETSRTSRIEARIAPGALLMVQRAAELQGRSVSDFVVAAAHEAAQKAIEASHLIRLSLDDQQRFAELLLSPPEPTLALKAAKVAHSRLVRESP